MSIKPSIAMVASAYKADKIYSALPENGDGDFDFIRTSGDASRIDDAGLIEQLGQGVPRLNYTLANGAVSGCPHILIEPPATNLLEASEYFGSSSWFKSSGIFIDQTKYTSPDGTLNAEKLTPTTGGNFVFVHQYITVPDEVIYTQTYFVKSQGIRYVQIMSSFNVFSNFYVNFDLQDGVVSATGGSGSALEYSIDEYPNGFYRIRVTSESIIASSSANFALNFIKTATTARGIDEGDFNGTDSILLWGAMLEQDEYATSYIETGQGTTTRALEVMSKTGLGNYINGSEGVIYADIAFNRLKSITTFNSISLQPNAGDSNDLISIFQPTSNNFIKVYMRQGGSTLINLQYSISATSFNKIALWYKSGDTKLFINGVLTATITTTFNPFSLTQIKPIFNNQADYRLKDFRVYDSNLITDSFLTELTT